MRIGPLGLQAVLATVGAGQAAAEDTTPLPVVPGAEQVVAHNGKHAASVEFDVRDPYPALKTIEYLVQTLAARGWTVTLPGEFGPRWPTQRPLPIATAYRGSHVWDGRWRDSAGNEITYRLVYDCPLEQHGMHSVFLHASGSRYGKKEADRREAERQRSAETERQRRHEEFCAELQKQSPEDAKAFCGK